MGFDTYSWDFVMPGESLPAVGAFAVVSTETVIFDTTTIRPADLTFLQQDPSGTNVQSCPSLKRWFLSVIADQALSLYIRHLSSMVTGSNRLIAATAGGTFWDPVLDNAGTPASPTLIPIASNPLVLNGHFFGDDLQLSLKTGGTPPTKVRLSLRLCCDQASAP